MSSFSFGSLWEMRRAREHDPRVGIVSDDPEDPLGFAAREDFGVQCLANKIDSSLELIHTSINKPMFVDGISFEDIVTESFGGPDAELSPSERLDSVSYRDNDVEIIVIQITLDLPFPL